MVNKYINNLYQMKMKRKMIVFNNNKIFKMKYFFNKNINKK